MPDPIDESRFSRYFAVTKVSDLPGDLPKDTNPRKQNLNTSVAKKIRESLIGHDTGQLFHLLNRGLLISAQSVIYDNKTNIMTLRLPNKEKHGLVDGGHTYEIIKRNLENMPFDQYVTMEIMTGIEEDFEEIAGARNTSVQVKEKSLAELEGKLAVIHTLMRGLPFEHDINYVEFDEHEIDVLDVIAILTIFHDDLHGNNHPIYCYSNKSNALKTYLNQKHTDSYLKLQDVVKDIFSLHDHIKRTMNKFYSGDFGKLKEIGYKAGKEKFPLKYSNRKVNGDFEKIKYDVPSGFVYPILGGMRFLIETAPTGSYVWKTDPAKFYDKHVAKQLIELTMEASKELGRNPMAVGKSVRHWNGLYNQVATTYYKLKK
jgi:hypothetical protein